MRRFQQHLQKWGYKGHKNGEIIDREFFDEHLSGGQNALLGKFLWPDRSTEEQARFGVEKEDLFRELARAVHPAVHPACPGLQPMYDCQPAHDLTS